tara:strand:- start:469 stop:1191 length:723 start_codon:yes stop_codon:yes gene_type:complete
MRQFFIYLVAAPLLVLAIALYIVFAEPTKKSYYWWGPERETYVMFSIVQQHHKGSIEIRARGKNFFKPGVPFKGEWMIWNNSFFERKFRVHFWIYDKKYRRWVKFTNKDKEQIITLAPMEDVLVSTIGYIDPEVMLFEREVYKTQKGFKKLPNSRAVTVNIVITDPDKETPDLSPKKFKQSKTTVQHEDGTVEVVDPGLRVGEGMAGLQDYTQHDLSEENDYSDCPGCQDDTEFLEYHGY